MAYIDYMDFDVHMDFDVRCPKNSAELNRSRTHLCEGSYIYNYYISPSSQWNNIVFLHLFAFEYWHITDDVNINPINTAIVPHGMILRQLSFPLGI